MSAAVTVRPMERTGNSANIVSYRERGFDGHGREPFVWASVLGSPGWERVDGVLRAKRGPWSYSLTIYRNRRGVIAETLYEPKATRGELSARTVTRLVREALA